MSSLLNIGGAAILSREHALAKAGHHLGRYLLISHEAQVSIPLPYGATPSEWAEAHAVLSVALAYSVDIAYDTYDDEDEELELDTGQVGDHIAYARDLSHVTRSPKNALLDESDWYLPAIDRLLEHHYSALEVLAVYLLDGDPTPETVNAILGIKVPHDLSYPPMYAVDADGNLTHTYWHGREVTSVQT